MCSVIYPRGLAATIWGTTENQSRAPGVNTSKSHQGAQSLNEEHEFYLSRLNPETKPGFTRELKRAQTSFGSMPRGLGHRSRVPET